MPIPIEALRQVRRIIVHRDCPDGIASAMILHDALPQASITAVAYGAERDALEPEPGLLFCDMTPPPAKVGAFADAGTIVLDHHRGARELVERFGERGVFADEDEEPGVSGAVLAHREVWWRLRDRRPDDSEGQQVLAFGIVAGIRDTWQTTSSLWRDACAQAEVLMFYGLEALIDARRTQPGYSCFGPRAHLSRPEAKLGYVLLDKKLRRAREIAEGGCLHLSSTVAIFNDAPKPDSRISDVAEAMRNVDPAVKLMCGFFYDPQGEGMQLTFSLRSSPGADLSAKQIAVANGGGGHEHAAGFTVCVGPWDEDDRVPLNNRSPVEIFKSALATAALP